MTTTDARLELLRDRKGPYGIGMVGCDDSDHAPHNELTVRPDKLPERPIERFRATALQRVPLSPVFRYTMEAHFSRELKGAMVARAGLVGQWQDGEPWWAKEKAAQDRNRRRYHGLKCQAHGIMNCLVGELLETAADPDALKAARRFRVRDRLSVYMAASRSRRHLDLVETFPVLAVLTCLDLVWDDFRDRCIEARHLVDMGAPLRQPAEIMGLPMALRKVPPGAAGAAMSVISVFRDRPDLIHSFLPESQAAMVRWLRALEFAKKYGPPFVEWTAQNAAGMGRTVGEVLHLLTDVGDWVRATYAASIPHYKLEVVMRGYATKEILKIAGSQFVARQFSPDMSLRTVLALSEDWHLAVANDPDTTNGTGKFPPPWCEAGKMAGYEFQPITNGADLYLEGREMRHCVSTYADRVLAGGCYVYSVTKDDEKVATMELIASQGKPQLGQIRGRCNSAAPVKIVNAARRWLRGQTVIRLPQPRQTPPWIGLELDDEIPF